MTTSDTSLGALLAACSQWSVDEEMWWALKQLSDESIFVEGLQAAGKFTAGAPVTVTGYSLGGHLATAFSELFPGAAAATYTFNGAGVGKVTQDDDPATPTKSLTEVINLFTELRSSTDSIKATFSDLTVKALYEELRADFGNGGRIPSAAEIARVQDLASYGRPQANVLAEAMLRIRSIGLEALRVNNEVSNTNGDPGEVSLQNIEALKLNYQLAVLLAGGFTEAHNSSIVVGGWQSIADREDNADLIKGNFYDVYGANKPSAVANSQLHHGKGVPVYIEAQPLVSSPPRTHLSRGLRRWHLKFRFATHHQNGVSHLA
jgi:pimeloyl-ACP methyl ester carboxylesterase